VFTLVCVPREISFQFENMSAFPAGPTTPTHPAEISYHVRRTTLGVTSCRLHAACKLNKRSHHLDYFASLRLLLRTFLLRHDKQPVFLVCVFVRVRVFVVFWLDSLGTYLPYYPTQSLKSKSRESTIAPKTERTKTRSRKGNAIRKLRRVAASTKQRRRASYLRTS
jgi:hypothetical protein